MRQVLHIFKKDIRHHCPEILLSLTVLAAFVWNEPDQWVARAVSANRLRDFLNGGLSIAVVISWCILVVRAVQGENLVGDRQFWVTKPYDRKKLISAKLLFMIAFISLPALIAGSVLFAEGGFGSPLRALPKIFLTQAGSIAFILVITTALATVTASITQFLLALLAVGVYVALAATVAAYVPSQSFSSGSDSLQEGILAIGCIVAILLQYIGRRTASSRSLLAVTAFAILAVIVVTPYQALVAREYVLRPAGNQPIQLAFDQRKPIPPEVVPRQEEKEVEIQTAIKVWAIAPATSVSVDGAMMSLRAPDGQNWVSGWIPVGLHLFPEDQGFNSSFKVKKSFFEHVKATPVQAHISFALSTFQNGETKRIVATSGEFKVPGLGFCSIVQGYSADSLRCRYAFETPTVLTTVSSSEMPCLVGTDGSPTPGLVSRDWSGSSASDPVSPIGTMDIYFWKWEGDTDTKSSPSVCPGTPLIFRTQEAGPQIRKEIEIDGIKLAEYQASNVVRFSSAR
jgi:ABC-type transport system involved in multi-copper enzyme maturation permease subunit